MTERVLIYLHKKGCTSRQIAEKYKVSKTTVLNWAKKYNISFVNTFDNPNTISPVIVKKLYRRGFSMREIAKLLKTNTGVISSIKTRYKLISVYKVKKFKELNHLNNETSLLIGCLLGDGSISKEGRFVCSHSMKQRDYCKWKADQLESYNIRFIDNQSRFDNRTQKTYHLCTFYSRGQNEYLKQIRNLFYTPTKQLTKDNLKYYNALSLAIHYMDDGTKTNSSYRIATNSFTSESLKVFIEHCFQCFKIKFVIHSDNKLYLPVVFKDRFEEIIRPYLHKTMMYKLH